jgi:hypothetical protein
MDMNQNQQPTMNTMPQTPSNGGKKKAMMWVVIVLVVIVVVGAVLWLMKAGKLPGGKVLGATSSYQAVFLTNGQVYFGKLSETDSNWVQLSDIYYLQVTQNLQNAATSDQTKNANPNRHRNSSDPAKHPAGQTRVRTPRPAGHNVHRKRQNPFLGKHEG